MMRSATSSLMPMRVNSCGVAAANAPAAIDKAPIRL